MIERVKKIIPAIIIILFLLIVFLYLQSNWLKVDHYIVESGKLPKEFDGYKIVQLSDLHGKEFGKNNRKIVNEIGSIKPDAIMITGDMLKSPHGDGDVFIKLIEQLVKKYPVYYTLGNHEQMARTIKNNNFESFVNRLKDLGVYYLDNGSMKIEKEDSYIGVYGLVIPQQYYAGKTRPALKDEKEYGLEDIKEVFNPSKEFKVLLAHNPVFFELYEKWGADLILSGHMHGGVIYIPFVGGVLSPERKFFPEYARGEFNRGSSTIIVNRGLGSSIINFRVFNRPEISVIVLKIN